MKVSGDLCLASDASAWRAIHKTIDQLCSLREQIICFPQAEQFERVALEFKQKQQFPGVIGCIDGSQIPIYVPKSDLRETFRNRKGFFSLNVQVVCGPDCYAYDVVASWPGSAHDSAIYKDSAAYLKLRSEEFQGFHILGDSAYPLSPFCMVPYRNESTAQERRFNYKQSATRMAIEKCFGQIKRRFPILKNGLRFKRVKDSAKCILACFILQNLCIKNFEEEFEGDNLNKIQRNIKEIDDLADSDEGRIKRDRCILVQYLFDYLVYPTSHQGQKNL